MKNELNQYTNTIKSFHMPGHKNGKLQVVGDFYHLDVTEVSGTDDMHHPEGIIKKALDDISGIYGSHKSYMLVNGSTSGILAALGGVTKGGDHIIMARNCHRSVYNGAMLGGLKVSYLYKSNGLDSAEEVMVPKDRTSKDEYDYRQANEIKGSVVIEELKEQLEDGIKAVVITSPTYEGVVSDIKEISKLVHQYKGVLIVDEAHGAHLTFSDRLPQSALKLGADIVIQSTHKTLPALTQTGLLHISEEAVKEKRVDVFKLERQLQIYQSSSPSYVFMNSIYESVLYMEANRKGFDSLVGEVIELKKWFNDTHHKVKLLMGSHVDGLRLTFMIADDCLLSGYDLNKELRKQASIQVELSGPKHIVAIVTIADSLSEIRELMEAIAFIVEGVMEDDKRSDEKLPEMISHDKVIIKDGMVNPDEVILKDEMIIPEIIMSIGEAVEADLYSVELNEADGLICGDFIIPYPPGIPLIVPGERFSAEVIKRITELIDLSQEVYGVVEVPVCGIIKREVKVLRG